MSYIGIRQRYVVKVEQDDQTGELFIKLPDEVAERLDIAPGDTVEWFELPNGAWQLTKKD